MSPTTRLVFGPCETQGPAPSLQGTVVLAWLLGSSEDSVTSMAMPTSGASAVMPVWAPREPSSSWTLLSTYSATDSFDLAHSRSASRHAQRPALLSRPGAQTWSPHSSVT